MFGATDRSPSLAIAQQSNGRTRESTAQIFDLTALRGGSPYGHSN